MSEFCTGIWCDRIGKSVLFSLFSFLFSLFNTTTYTGEMLVHGHKRCQTFSRCLQTPRMTAFHWRTVFWRLSFSASKDFQVAPPRGATCPTFFFLLFRLHCCNIRMCNLIFWALCFAHVIAYCGRGIWCFAHTYTRAQKYCGWRASLKKHRSFVVQCFIDGRS